MLWRGLLDTLVQSSAELELFSSPSRESHYKRSFVSDDCVFSNVICCCVHLFALCRHAPVCGFDDSQRFLDMIVQSSAWLELLSLPSWASLSQEAWTRLLFHDLGWLSSKNRLLKLRFHPLELPTMIEAFYLSMSFLVMSFLWVCRESVTAVACASFQSEADWSFWAFCLASPSDGGRSCVKRDGGSLRVSSTGSCLNSTSVCSCRLLLKNYSCKGLLLSTMAQKYWVRKLAMFLSHSRQEVAFVQQISSIGCCLTLTSSLHVFRLAVFLKNYRCKGLLSSVASKYWVLEITMFLSYSRLEVAFVYDGGLCVFQLAHARMKFSSAVQDCGKPHFSAQSASATTKAYLASHFGHPTNT